MINQSEGVQPVHCGREPKGFCCFEGRPGGLQEKPVADENSKRGGGEGGIVFYHLTKSDALITVIIISLSHSPHLTSPHFTSFTRYSLPYTTSFCCEVCFPCTWSYLALSPSNSTASLLEVYNYLKQK